MLDPGKEEPTVNFQLSKETTRRSQSYGNWPSKPAQNLRSYRGWNSTELQFKTDLNKFDDDSRICSPPLWTTSPTRSPQNGNYNYQSLSPSSRTQAIARGQRELMEMVRSMPESNYELSLKDLVERGTAEEVEEESSLAEDRILNPNYRNVHRKESNATKNGKKISGNIDGGGFYLKMMFPTSLGSKKKKKKKNDCLGNNYLKVSPRPSISEESLVKEASEKEWWKKSSLASAGSDSGVSSMNSGSMKSSSSSSRSSSASNSRRERSGGSCWPFIQKPKNPKV